MTAAAQAASTRAPVGGNDAEPGDDHAARVMPRAALVRQLRQLGGLLAHDDDGTPKVIDYRRLLIW